MTETTITKKVPFSFPVEIVKHQTEGGALHVVGYVATDKLDRQGDIITIEALKAAAQDLLRNPTLFLDHDPKRAIGRIVSVGVDENGLLIDAIISAAEPEIATKVREGVLSAFSIRGRVIERERKFSKEHDRVVNVIRKLELIESSLVGLPANPAARSLGWYVRKAFVIEGAEGGEDMDDVTVEPITDEAKPGAGDNPQPEAPQGGQKEPAQAGQGAAPGQGQAQPPAQGADQAPAQEPTKPAQDAPQGQQPPKPDQGTAPAPQKDKPAEGEPQDELTKAMNVRLAGLLEPVYALLDRLISQVDEKSKPLAQQIKTMLKAVAGQAYPYPYPAPGKGMEDVATAVSAEVQKQLKKALEEIPTVRKGLAPNGGAGNAASDDEVIKAFEQLDPSDKLRALLKVQHGRKQ